MSSRGKDQKKKKKKASIEREHNSALLEKKKREDLACLKQKEDSFDHKEQPRKRRPCFRKSEANYPGL